MSGFPVQMTGTRWCLNDLLSPINKINLVGVD
jgi:hypothetical protein